MVIGLRSQVTAVQLASVKWFCALPPTLRSPTHVTEPDPLSSRLALYPSAHVYEHDASVTASQVVVVLGDGCTPGRMLIDNDGHETGTQLAAVNCPFA